MSVDYLTSHHGLKLVTSVTDVPKEEHYVIMTYETKTVHVPEAGHGYPSYYAKETTVKQYVTTKKSDWKDCVCEVAASGFKDFVAFKVAKLAKTKVEIQLEDD